MGQARNPEPIRPFVLIAEARARQLDLKVFLPSARHARSAAEKGK
jgi:hypothetical protein